MQEAERLYTQAAESGFPRAFFQLGRLSEKKGMFMTAASYYTSACREGHPRAQNRLAHLYETGAGVEQDLDRAFSLFLQSADEVSKLLTRQPVQPGERLLYSAFMCEHDVLCGMI